VRTRKGTASAARSIGLAAALVAIAVWVVRPAADVSVAPAWRLSDGISAALPAGNLIYVGGVFTQLFTPSTSEHQFYDLVAGQVRSECARSTNPQRAIVGYPDLRGGLLVPLAFDDAFADELGAFVPPPGATMVRIADTCLWDRQFAGDPIDPLNPDDTTIGVPARVGNLIVAANSILVNFALRAQAAAFSADTGSRVRFKDYPGVSEIGVLGATDSRVIVRVRRGSGAPYFLGTIDPTDLTLNESTSVLADESLGVRSWVRGSILYRSRPAPSNLLEAYDLTTLQPQTGWTAPVIPSLLDVETAGSRVFVTARVIDGQVVNPPAALAAASGALDATWTPPPLTRKVPDPTGKPYEPTLTALATDGIRLYFSGDFERVGGLDRDGVAALTTSSGALDIWDAAPWVVAPLEATTTALFATRPTAANRTARRYLAAINRADGTVAPWNPNDAGRVLQHTPTPVAALAVDATHVYFASATTGEILRADVTTADVDLSWRLVVSRSDGTPGVATSLIVTNGVVHLGGDFDTIAGPTVPSTARRALAAVGVDGTLRPWAPALNGPSGSTLLRSMLLLGTTIYLGGDFTEVNREFRLGFAAVDTANGGLAQPEMFVLGETSINGLATDGVQVFVAGSSDGAPLVGAVSVPGSNLTTFGPVTAVPRSAAFVAGRLYAGVEFDVDAGVPTARQTTWGRVVADDQGLIHFQDDGSIDYYPAEAGNPPGPPTLTANAVGNTVTMNWTPDPAGGAPTSYTLYAGSVPGGRDLAALVVRGTTTFTADAPTGLYYLTVVARNGFGESAPSNEVAVQAGCVAPPPVPSPLTFTTAGSVVTLWWATAATASSYALEAGDAPGSSNIGVLPLGNVQSFTATAPLGVYYVRVRASNACGTSGASNEAAVTLDGTISVPNAPTGLVWILNGRTLGLQWTPPKTGGMPSGYQIEAGLSPGGLIATVPTTTPGLIVPNAPSGTFYIRVRAGNAAGLGPPTAEITVSIP
jgi:hypothetical protein